MPTSTLEFVAVNIYLYPKDSQLEGVFLEKIREYSHLLLFDGKLPEINTRFADPDPNQPGWYRTSGEIALLDFRAIGESFLHGAWGTMDYLIWNMSYEEVFGQEAQQLLAQGKKVMTERDPNGLMRAFTFITLWQVTGYTNHTQYGEDHDTNWYLHGIVDIKRAEQISTLIEESKAAE